MLTAGAARRLLPNIFSDGWGGRSPLCAAPGGSAGSSVSHHAALKAPSPGSLESCLLPAASREPTPSAASRCASSQPASPTCQTGPALAPSTAAAGARRGSGAGKRALAVTGWLLPWAEAGLAGQDGAGRSASDSEEDDADSGMAKRRRRAAPDGSDAWGTQVWPAAPSDRSVGQPAGGGVSAWVWDGKH